MTFEHPHAFWFLLLLAPAAFLIAWSFDASRRQLRALVPERLERSLVRAGSAALRWARWGFILLALIFAIAAAAAPTWGVETRKIQRTGRDVIIAIDVSKSMYAPDLSPNRLARARLAAQDLIERLDGDRVGIVAFAGRAFLQAPLTIDYESVVRTLVELEPDIIPMGGTNISEAIKVALDAFGKAEGNNRALVIMSDGEELADDAMKLAREAANKRILICTVGVGTPEGALIALPRDKGFTGDFVRDERGEVVKSRLDETRLKEIATASGGVYARLGDVNALEPVVGALGRLEKQEVDNTTEEIRILRFQWPLAGALAFLLASMALPERVRARRLTRATRTAAVASLLMCCMGAARADAAARSKPDDPAQLYSEGKYAEAYSAHLAQQARSHSDLREYNAGCAAFKVGNFKGASEAFANALRSENTELQQKAHYNLGNTLYRMGEAADGIQGKLDNWRSALQHYESALDINPKDQAARVNRDLVRKKIEELERRQQQQQQQQGGQQQKQEQEQQQGEKQQQQQPGGQDQQQPRQDDQDQKQKQPQGGSDQEQQQQQGGSPQQAQNQEPQQGGQQEQQQGGGQDKEQEKKREEQSGSSDSQTAQNDKPDAGQQPVPQAQRDKPLEGELKAQGESREEQKENQQADAQLAQEGEGEPTDGEMTQAQAARLLELLGREEDRVLLYEHKRREPVYKDW